jgi:hypothetical protein
VTTIDNQSRISIHYYVVEGWRQMCLFTLEQLVEGETTINIKVVIFVVFLKFGGLFEDQVAQCLVCLGVDGAFAFPSIILLH